MDNELFLWRIHNKTPSIAKLILLFKYSTSKSPLLISITVLIKLLGLIILSSNFVISDNDDNVYKLQGTYLFRQFTCFGLVFPSLTYPVYYAICFLIYTIQISFAAYLIFLIKKIKHKQYKGLTVNAYGKFCFYINILLSQHMLEWLTFVIFSLAKTTFSISYILYPHYINKFPMLSQPKTIFINSLYLFGNILMYIFINSVTYYSFYVLNSSLFSNISPMRYRHLIQSTVAIVCQIVYSFHYIEVLVSGSKIALIIFKVMMQILIILPLVSYYILSIKKFEYTNTLGIATKVILNYTFFSALIEIFISLSHYHLNVATVTIVFLLKVLISFLFTRLYYFIKSKKLSAFCTEVLFNLNEERSLEDYLELGAFIISLLTESTTQQESEIKEMVTIILDHTKACTSSFCKCKIINILPHSTTNAIHYKKLLFKRLGYLIETTFIRLDLLKCFGIVFLLAEYYYLCTNNAYLAYTIIQSYLAINKTKITLLQYIDFYSLQLEYVNNCYCKYHKGESYVKFSVLFKEIFQKKEINKQVLEYCDNFIKLISIKEAIESTIKIDYDDNGDIKEISSKSLSIQIVNKILSFVILQGRLYVNIDKVFAYHSNESFKFEYYYQMYLFYLLFNTKIPHHLKKSFKLIDQTINKTTSIGDDMLKIKFEAYLKNYFQLRQKEYYLMIKCDKGFTISYFSSELSKFLKFNQSSIIGEPFYTIFPPEFREIHKEAILKELLKQEYYYYSKHTFIFDASGYSYVCGVKIAVLPHLSKYSSIICEVLLDLDKIESNQSFILNDYYNLVSLSKILESKFALNAELIKKCEIDVLDIFEISKVFLQKTFESFLKSVAKLKESFKGDTVKILSKWFFLSKQISDDTIDISKTKEKLIQCARTMKHPIKGIPSESTLIERKQLVILHNIIKLLARFSEIDLHDESYKKFNETFHQFQTTFNANTLKSMQYSKEATERNYTINIEARCLYDTPIYIVSFQLNQYIHSNQFDQDTDASLNYENLNGNNYKNYKTCLKDLTPLSSMTMNNISFLDNNNNDKKNIDTLPTVSNPSLNVKGCLFVSSEKKNRQRVHMYSDENIIYTTLTKLFFFFAFVIGIALFIVLFIYHRIYFEKIRILLDTINSNALQRDIMAQLFASQLSLISHIVGISSTEYDINTYIDLSKNALSLMQKSFKTFTYSYMTYSIEFNEEINQLEVVHPYISILHDWYNYTYTSEFASELNKFLFLGQKTVTEPIDTEAIYADMQLLFQKNYLMAPNTLVKTSFAMFSFYIVNNISRLYQWIHLPLYNSLLVDLKHIKEEYLLYTWIIEIVVFIHYFFFFIFFFVILRRMNSDVFYMIVEMFLYTNRYKRDSLKSMNGNLLIKQKVLMFCEVINNFNEENCIELQKKQREKASTINDQQLNLTTSQSITTGGNMTNSTNYNISSNQMLNKNTSSSLLRRLNTNSKDTTHQNHNNHSSQQQRINTILDKNALWSTPEFIKYFKVKHLWHVLLFKLFTILCLLICVSFSALRLISATDYTQHINLIQVNIDYLAGKFTLALTLFNNIRTALVYDMSSLEFIGNFSQIMTSITDNQELFDNTVIHFPLTGAIQQQTRLKNTDPLYNTTILCGEFELCHKILKLENNFCTDGIDFGINTILQKYFQIIKDFKTGRNEKITIDEIKKYFKENNMDSVEQTIDFVLIRVLERIYYSFMIDSKKLRIEAELYVYLMTYPTMFIILVIDIIFVLVIYLYISKSFNAFSKEVFKLNNAFFNYPST